MLFLNGKPVAEVQLSPVMTRETDNGIVSYRDVTLLTFGSSVVAETHEIPRTLPGIELPVDDLVDRLKTHKGLKVTILDPTKEKEEIMGQDCENVVSLVVAFALMFVFIKWVAK